MAKTSKLLRETDLKRIFERFAFEFTEPYDDPASIAIIGMQRRGVFIAQRVRRIIKEQLETDVPFGVLDVTFYRDDFRTSMKMPEVQITEIPFDLYGKHIILVDDVLYTGRTVRAALEALMSFGRPASIRFCCLIDRGHRELPLAPDYTGMYVPTHTSEEVQVKLSEIDDEDAVYIVELPQKAKKEAGDE
ncbi:MAG: bifunctional pyr operon transcriptional regulator/uracil phosphoribosyltransferase PyrR [Balneolia bacterium]|nr:bifunctional pyr operon transcriptional regulator/uracil phosphoribosyltransferase PyrR [Balneolia bacterium]